MKYFVKIGRDEVEVLIDGDSVIVGGERIAARIADVEGSPVRLLTVGMSVHRVIARRSGAKGNYALWVDGRRFDVESLDERSRTIRELSAATTGPAGPAPLKAPMPGMIVRVSVQQGDAVHAGQGLVVMEAMKMENELRAGGAGTVKRVHVTPGTAVEKGALLLELE